MNSTQRNQAIVMAVVGCLGIAGYLWFMQNSNFGKLIPPQMPTSSIFAKAEQAFASSPLAGYDLKRKISLDIDGDLSRFVQQYLHADSVYQKLPLGHWTISWRKKTSGNKKDSSEVLYSVSYGLNGEMVGFEQKLPKSAATAHLQESDALLLAKEHVVSFGNDTTHLALSNRKVFEEIGVLKYEYTFTRACPLSPDLQEQYEVAVSGDKISRYNRRVILDKDHFAFPKIAKTLDIVGSVLAGIIWLVLIILVIVLFIKRLRHDELEFKRAFWIALLVCLAMWGNVAYETWGEWVSVLIGGGFAGVFTGAGIVIVYAVAEAYSRDIWKEKLLLTDLFFRGNFRVRELGLAILRAFFVIGGSLLTFGAALWLASLLHLGYLDLGNDRAALLWDQYGSLVRMMENVVEALFVGLLLFSLLITALRAKIRRTASVVLLSTVLLGLSGFHLAFLHPNYMAIWLALPAVLLLSYFACKYDLFTTLLAIAGVYFCLDFGVLFLAPEMIFSLSGVATLVGGGLALLAGVYLSFSPKSVSDFGDYVPDYVSRIAERERFLKELEIARSVQMRFLPQSIPVFPSLDIASICRPAMEVGGDYYDFIPTNRGGERRLSVVIGDVSGKGISAAFYMTMAKGIIKTLSRQVQEPKQLLAEMNSIFYENAPRGVFISVIYGLFDMQAKTITFARAGHNPLIVRKRKKEEPELLNPNGMAIGLAKEQIFAATIEQTTIAIEPEDIFVFYTDGISESMNSDGQEFGEDRLRQLITAHAHESAQALLERITAAVDTFAGNANQHDDLTMVVVKVNSQ